MLSPIDVKTYIINTTKLQISVSEQKQPLYYIYMCVCVCVCVLPKHSGYLNSINDSNLVQTMLLSL